MQLHMNALLTVHLPDPTRHKCVLVDRHTVPSFGARKPDFVAYVTTTDVVSAGAGSSASAGAPVPRVEARLMPISLDTSHAVFIGDVKRRRGAGNDGVFTDEEKGHAIGMLADLVKHQPYRASPFGGSAESGVGVGHAFLTDAKHIIFFRVLCSVTGGAAAVTRVEETRPVLLRDEGMQCLDAILTSAPASLGFVEPKVVLPGGQILELKSLLGAGATSLVYAASPDPHRSTGGTSGWHSGQQYAVKILTGRDADHMTQELAVLQKLNSSSSGPSQHLLRLHGFCNDKKLLVLSPVCSTAYSLRKPPPELPISHIGARLVPGRGSSSASTQTSVTWRPSADDLCDMADALHELHSRGFVHRDARPENFMRDAEGRMVLLDFGAASHVGSRHDTRRPWGFTYGPLRVLQAMADGVDLPVTRPADDFEQLARVAVIAAAGASPALAFSPAELLEQWLALDDLLPDDGAAHKLLALVTASEVDVGQLKVAIRCLLP